MTAASTRCISASLIIPVLTCLMLGCTNLFPTAKEQPASATTPQQPPGKDSVPASPEPGTLRHVVRWQGETLSHIALWYTGKIQNWRKIAGANPTLKLDRIRVGDRIRIPADLVITREPMPFEFLAGFSGGSTHGVGPQDRMPAKSHELLLFGPVDSSGSQPNQTSGKPPATGSERIELFGPVEEN